MRLRRRSILTYMPGPANLDAPNTQQPVGRVALAAALLLGAIYFCADTDFRSRPQYLAMAVGIFAFIPSVRSNVERWLMHLRNPSPRTKWLTAAILFVVATRYFIFSANSAGRDLIPIFHDEHMYLLQARMLAAGKLWANPHALSEFFDSFYVIGHPVYAATYFPGTALFYVPGMWVHAAPFATSTLICGLIVSLLYTVFCELLDGVAGIFAALLAVSLEQLRVLAVMTMSHTVMLLLLLLVTWSYLRWQKTHTVRWALAVGIFMGWAAIARPLDAICLVGPLGLAILFDLKRLSTRTCSLTLAAILIGALPFISLQLWFDKKVTGHFFDTPISQYARQNFPGLGFSIHDPVITAESRAPLPQVRDYYAQFFRDDFRKNRGDNFWKTWILRRLEPATGAALPVHLLLILIPVGFLGLRGPGKLALAFGAMLLPLAFAFYPSYLTHYGLVTAPGFLLLVLLGLRTIGRSSPVISLALVLGIAGVSIGSLPEISGTQDHFMHAPYLADINAKLSQLEHTPAVVLFHYQSGKADVHEEPVYNLDTVNPDDAPVIRAQDLGAENYRIFDYYGVRQPNRFFYRYDRTTGQLSEIGWAKDLAGRAR